MRQKSHDKKIYIIRHTCKYNFIKRIKTHFIEIFLLEVYGLQARLKNTPLPLYVTVVDILALCSMLNNKTSNVWEKHITYDQQIRRHRRVGVGSDDGEEKKKKWKYTPLNGVMKKRSSHVVMIFLSPSNKQERRLSLLCKSFLGTCVFH